MNRVEEAIKALRNNEIILVTDDETRENEGDLICAGEAVTGQMINIMATYGKGLICTPVGRDIASRLSLDPMVKQNSDNHETAFTIAIDHVNTSTGISAYERAETIRALAADETIASDFRRPGHVFPLVAKDGGVLERDGHTEATVDLLKLAGLKEVGVCCEIMADDGHMMRGEDLIKLAEKLDIRLTTVDEIKKYRSKLEVDLISTNPISLPTDYGNFKAYGFLDRKTGKEHMAIVKGDIKKEKVLTRIHSECLTGDVLGSRRCDCGSQLHKALRKIEENGSGLILYLRQEGRGIGLFNKLKAYELQEKGFDTVDANLKLGFPEDMRDYKIASEMLRALKVKSVDLMTNNPDKINQLENYGIKVDKRFPIEIKSNDTDRRYLEIKALRMGHELEEFKEIKNA